MRFLSLSVRNFLSFESEHIDLNTKGLIFIKGVNRDSSVAGSNGSGKSALVVDAWCWVLYGKTPRGVSGNEVVRRDSGGGCCVSITFYNGKETYQVVRFQNDPKSKNKLELRRYLPAASEAEINTEDISLPDKRETQAMIERLLGFSYDIALSAIVLGQNSISFAKRTDSEKKGMLEKILEFDKLVAAGERAKKKSKQLTLEKTGKEQLSVSWAAQRVEVSKRFEELNQKSSNWEKLTEAERKLWRQSLEVVQEALVGKRAEESRLDLYHKDETERRNQIYQGGLAAYNELQVGIGHEKEARVRYTTLTNRAFPDNITVELAGIDKRAKESISPFEVELQRLQFVSVGTCPTCGQDWDSDEGMVKRNNQIQNLQRQIATITSDARRRGQELHALIEEKEKWALDVESAETDLSTIGEGAGRLQLIYEQTQVGREELDQKIQKQSTTLGTLRQEITELEQQQTTFKASLEAQQPENPFTVAIQNTEADIVDLDQKMSQVTLQIDTYKKQIELYDFWVKGFGKSGIQSYLLDGVVPYLNERIADYAQIMWAGETLIEFKTQRELLSGNLKEDFHVAIDNSNGAVSYDGCSAGERERIDICIALALQDLVISRRGTDFNLCVLDEVARYLDPEGAETYFNLLQYLTHKRETVFTVTHSPHLEALFLTVWTVVKQNKISQLLKAA